MGCAKGNLFLKGVLWVVAHRQTEVGVSTVTATSVVTIIGRRLTLSDVITSRIQGVPYNFTGARHQRCISAAIITGSTFSAMQKRVFTITDTYVEGLFRSVTVLLRSYCPVTANQPDRNAPASTITMTALQARHRNVHRVELPPSGSYVLMPATRSHPRAYFWLHQGLLEHQESLLGEGATGTMMAGELLRASLLKLTSNAR